MPQGCPASPLALLLLLRLPAMKVQEKLGAGATQAIFIDDRNMVVATANQARQAVGLWECEASALGLCENQRKRKFVGKSTRQRQALRALELEPAEEAEILGTTFGIQESEIVNTKRTQVFAQTLQRLCTFQSRRSNVRSCTEQFCCLSFPGAIGGQWGPTNSTSSSPRGSNGLCES